VTPVPADNMSIIGVTIDYGPFGFLDAYNPDHVCNGSDDSGRYAYRWARPVLSSFASAHVLTPPSHDGAHRPMMLSAFFAPPTLDGSSFGALK
jgi:hypothetical protein